MNGKCDQGAWVGRSTGHDKHESMGRHLEKLSPPPIVHAPHSPQPPSSDRDSLKRVLSGASVHADLQTHASI